MKALAPAQAPGRCRHCPGPGQMQALAPAPAQDRCRHWSLPRALTDAGIGPGPGHG